MNEGVTFTCECDSSGGACLKTSTCYFGCADGECLPEPTPSYPTSVTTPPPYPTENCTAGQVREFDSPQGLGKTETLGVEEITVFGHSCSSCRTKTTYNRGMSVDQWISWKADAGDPGACKKMVLTDVGGNTTTMETWYNGLRQICVKQDGRLLTSQTQRCV